MADDFDVVSVGTDDERGIVARVVLRAQTGATVVLAARLQRRAMERVDLLATLGGERQVQMRRLLLGLEQTNRLEEERLARGEVADSELDVVERAQPCEV